MIFLQSTFLIGYIGITIEYFTTLCTGFCFLDIPRIFELGTIVCEDDGKVLFESTNPDGIAQVVDGSNNAALCTVRKKWLRK